MVILKYGFLVSYTKVLARYFFPVVGGSGVNPNTLCNTLENYSEETKHEYSVNIKELRHVERINNINNSNPNKIFYFETIEDILSLAPNFIDPFIDSLKDSGHKIVVLFPMADPYKRLYSIILRKIGAKQKPIKKTVPDNINSLIQYRYYQHLSFYNYSETDLSSFSFMNFDSVILLSCMEHLVQLHKKGLIDFIPVSEKTILNDPKIIFDKLSINASNESLLAHGAKEVSINKEQNLKNLKLYNSVVEKNKDVINNRYKEISQLLANNNIEVL